MQADGIKLALCRADAAANALVRVHNAGTAAQTARCLDFDLILGQRQVRVTEGTVRVNARIQRGGLARCAVILAQRQIRLVQLVEVAAVAANRQAGVGLYKAVDGNCPLLARSNRVNGKPRPGADVAADENVRFFSQ